MTYKEMVDHLALDREKLQIKKDILRPKAIRELKKEKNFQRGDGMNILFLRQEISMSYFSMPQVGHLSKNQLLTHFVDMVSSQLNGVRDLINIQKIAQ